MQILLQEAYGDIQTTSIIQDNFFQRSTPMVGQTHVRNLKYHSTGKVSEKTYKVIQMYLEKLSVELYLTNKSSLV